MMTYQSSPTSSMMLLFLAVLITTVVMVVVVNRRPSVQRVETIGQIPPGTLADVAQQAKQQHKRIYVEFYAKWCSACRTFAKQVLDTPEVQTALKQVVFLAVDSDKETALTELFKVHFIPTGFLLAAEGDQWVVMDRHEGLISKEAFLKFLSPPGPTGGKQKDRQ